MQIFVATDMRPGGDDAVREGARQASVYGAELTVCHVLSSARRSRRSEATDLALDLDCGREVRNRVSVLTNRGADTFDVLVRHGDVPTELIAQSSLLAADVLVLGGAANGAIFPNATGRALGRVASRVGADATCDVFIVRGWFEARRRGSVLAATDLTDPELPVVRAAMAHASLSGDRLTLLHISDESSGLPRDQGSRVGGSNERERIRAVLASRVDELGGADEILIASGAPEDEILAVATRVSAGTIVIGRGGGEVATDRAAAAVLRAADCSVLTVSLSRLQTLRETRTGDDATVSSGLVRVRRSLTPPARRAGSR